MPASPGPSRAEVRRVAEIRVAAAVVRLLDGTHERPGFIRAAPPQGVPELSEAIAHLPGRLARPGIEEPAPDRRSDGQAIDHPLPVDDVAERGISRMTLHGAEGIGADDADVLEHLPRRRVIDISPRDREGEQAEDRRPD